MTNIDVLDVIDALQEAFSARMKYNRDHQHAIDHRVVSWDWGGHSLKAFEDKVEVAQEKLDAYINDIVEQKVNEAVEGAANKAINKAVNRAMKEFK